MIRELMPAQTRHGFAAMRELRGELSDAAEFSGTVDKVLRPGGYRLTGVFTDDSPDAVTVPGFRIGDSLAWGHHLYVDDFVTRQEHRGQGYAKSLLRWLFDEAERNGCRQLHLDSGTHRHGAHRFYLGNGLDISSFHFTAHLGG